MSINHSEEGDRVLAEGTTLPDDHGNWENLGVGNFSSVKIETIRSEHEEDKILKLATFIMRQPRFAAYEGDKQELLENIILRYKTGLQDGRHITIMTSAIDESEEGGILGYIYYKTTGEFHTDELNLMLHLARENIPPRIIYKNLIHDEIPSFQLKGNASEKISWDLSGSLRYLFSHYEADRDVEGTVGFLLLAEVDPGVRKHGLSKQLIEAALDNFRSLGVSHVVAFARCAQLAQYEPDPQKATTRLQEYIKLRDDRGMHPDYGIRFHQRAGAQIICGIPNSSPDPESHNNMCLVIYSLAELTKKAQ